MVGGHQEKARYFGERANCHAGHVKEGGELGCCLEVYICAFTGPLLHKWNSSSDGPKYRFPKMP